MYVSQKRKARFLFSNIVVLASNGINGKKYLCYYIIKHIYFMVVSKGWGLFCWSVSLSAHLLLTPHSPSLTPL